TLSAADVVVAVGTRFTAYVTGGRTLELEGDLIHIDIDPSQMGTHFPPKEALIGDAGAVLEQLLEVLPVVDRDPDPSLASRKDRFDELRAAFPTEIDLASSIRRAVPRDGILSLDM